VEVKHEEDKKSEHDSDEELLMENITRPD